VVLFHETQSVLPEGRCQFDSITSGQNRDFVADGCRVSLRRVSLPMAFTYRSKPLAPGTGSPFQAKAILEPSGEKAGEVFSPGKAVNGTAFKAVCSCC
jgi:hypothetical protein